MVTRIFEASDKKPNLVVLDCANGHLVSVLLKDSEFQDITPPGTLMFNKVEKVLGLNCMIILFIF